MKFPASLFAIGIILISCSKIDNSREAGLRERDSLLTAREQALALKEADYQNLIKMRDSIQAQQDSLAVTPQLSPVFAGRWNGKVVCTESNCSDYVVGDTRVDAWELTIDGSDIVLSNTNKSGSVQVYKGQYDGTNINLTNERTTDSGKLIEIRMQLNNIGQKRISGTRELQVDKNCTAKYTVELIKE
ncbi:hypothetical protein SAMN05443429_101442 [Cruoricaptor ignavus]|uniref:Uncharacterized protein n=1 Tax=Cruoricaptor ignavus TaxID=1118202 RepID=A0A1M6AWG6_9FLAO|nr:hypothetical protein [Cruoricaptor ignavus]SHI40826.1 hypothetical protein SAMN05443429_101442 [Cruoricaptor ignavus]